MANKKQKARRDKERRQAIARAKAATPEDEFKEPAPAAEPIEGLPRIIGLLCWYDENPAWLAATIASLSKLRIDHLVALDGAYALFPDGRHSSPPEQHAAIVETCVGLGIGYTLHIPQTVWHGNEVEKRSKLFSLGEQAARANHDWYMVMDADQLVKDCPEDLRERLSASEEDAAVVTFHNRSAPTTEQERAFNWDPITKEPIPIFFRAIPGLQVIGNHFTYETPDGRKLWGAGEDKASGLVEDFYDLTDLTIDHRTAYRGKNRSKRQWDYYQRREVTNIEHPICCRCKKEPEKVVHTDFTIDSGGDLRGRSVHACAEHADEIAEESVAQLKELGVDPNMIDWDAVRAVK